MKRIMGAVAAVTVMLVFASTATAQATGVVEDFEDQTIGSLPSNFWYTASVGGTSCSGSIDAGTRAVSAGGPSGSTKAYRNQVNSGQARTCFTLSETVDLCEVGSMRFDWLWSTGTNSGWLFGSSGSSSDPHFGILLGNGGEISFRNAPGGLGTQEDIPLFTSAPDTWYGATFEFDCAAQTVSGTIGGVGYSKSVGSLAATLSVLRVSAVGPDADDLWIDNIVVEIGDPAELVPAEFDRGLKDMIASIGIVSPESQMFFVILFVGAAVVGTAAALLWTGPGRLKNGILVGVQSLVAVLMVFFGFLELWGLMLMIMLGAFAAFGGARVARNTFYEVQDALASAKAPKLPFLSRGGKTLTNTAQDAAEDGGDDA